jgi:MYXO-CTERM domain-containing protein
MARALVRTAGLCVALAPALASGFPGLYVAKHDAAMGSRAASVVLLRDGTRTVVTLQTDYRGPAEAFALVIPVPGALVAEDVRIVDRRVMDRLDAVAAPTLIEQWERDPCAAPEEAPGKPAPVLREAPATFQDGEYSFMAPGAGESAAIVDFLRMREYQLSAAAEAALQPYADAGMRFLIAEVDPSQVHFNADGEAVLSPLRYHYDSERLVVPLRIGTVNALGVQDLVVHTIAVGQRYEAGNYPAALMPTSVLLRREASERVGQVHAALLDAVLAHTPGAVVGEFAGRAGGTWQAGELAALGTEVAPGLGRVRDEALVITRLHTRLGVEEMTQDLELRAARAIVGGSDAHPQPVASPVPDPAIEGENGFATRLLVRHPFAGRVGCEHPQRGVWEAVSPAGVVAEPRRVRAMSKVERSLPLGEMLAQDLPELGVTAVRRCGCGVEAPAGPGLLALVVLAGLCRRRRAG